MEIEKHIIKKYNMSNTIIITILIAISIGLIILIGKLAFLMIPVLVFSSYMLIKQNQTKLKQYLRTKKREHFKTNQLKIASKPQPAIDSEYIKEVLPSPSNLPITKFEHYNVASGKSLSGREYSIDYLDYIGHIEGAKGMVKKFDLSSYVISVDYNEHIFCNRPLLYLNAHSDISKYHFKFNHKLVLRRSNKGKVKLTSNYIHNRLIAYNGFHDKHVKAIETVLNYNPNLFKKQFCKGAIFDQNKIYFLADDSLVTELKLEFHYLESELNKLITDQEHQFSIFEKYVDSLTNIDDGKVKTKELV